MMKTALKISNLKFVLISAVFALAFIGCSGDAPLAPLTGDVDGLNSLTFIENELGSDPFTALEGDQEGLAKRNLGCISFDRAFVDVDAEGGILYLDFNGAVSEFEIPKNAVCSDDDDGDDDDDGESGCNVRITAVAIFVQTPYGPLALYDFGPDGLEFARDCELRLKTGFHKGDKITLYWFNPDKNKWQVEQRVKVGKKGAVEFKIRHFSKYAIS